ncbi:HEAT repeat domain-containing protein [Calothrix sp. CCY 0018]|uniref:HEAT repeat domain-containing protein n=1 Tax=Calothrix sp. CCY 0018 TaxID=3103864 RepID=UPI0039C72440
MNDWNFFDHNLDNLELNNYRIFAPDYKAEILYWFSRDDIPKQQKEAFIRALVNFDDDCGGFYRYRAYFLAAEALNYFPESSFGDRIVKQLLDWSYIYFGWQLFPQPLLEAARNTLKVTHKTRVVKAFEYLLRNTPSRLTLQSAAVKLGELDVGNKMAIAALILLLDVTQENYKRSSICRSIGKIGAGNQAAINAVIKLMETTEDKSLCCEAIKTLGKIGCGNQTAILALEKFLQINRGDRICLDVAEALLLIDVGNEIAKDSLVYILESTQEMYLLVKAVEFLQEVDSRNQAAIKVLSERLKTCEDNCCRAEIAASLGRFDRNQVGVKETLIQLLETSENNFLFGLEYLRILNENELYFYPRIITSLVQLYPGDTEVILSFISFIEKSSNINDGSSLEITCLRASGLAIYAISKMLLDKNIDLVIYQESIAALRRILHSPKGKIFEVDLAEAILRLEPENELAVSIIVEWMQVYQSENAAAILLQVESHYQKAINTLIELDSLNKLSILFQYERLLPEIYLDKIAKEDKTARVLINESISAEFKRLLNAIEKDKLFLFNNCKPDENDDFDEDLFSDIMQNVNSINKYACFPEIITALKGYLSKKFYQNCSYRHDDVYQFMWNCAEKMSYQDFYQAWHS